MKHNRIFSGTLGIALFLFGCLALMGQEGRFTASFLTTNFVNVSGDTMTGALDVSAKGLTQGHSASVYLAKAHALTSAKTTRVVWDTERWDIDGEHDTATGRFTASLAGKHEVKGVLTFDANTTTGRTIYVMKNADTSPDPSSADIALIAGGTVGQLSKAPASFPFQATVDLDAADYVEVFALDNSGFNIGLAAPSGSPEVIMNHATFRRVGE